MKNRQVLVWLFALALVGCEGPGGRGALRPPPPTVDVAAFSLSSSPTALNWDDKPGPDGVIARVQFFRLGSKDEVLSVPVKGELEFLLFDSRVPAAEVVKAQPSKTWSFPAEDLPNFLGKQMGMWAYQMQLDWRDKPPKASVVTLVARWKRPDGAWRYSDPTLVAVSLR